MGEADDETKAGQLVRQFEEWTVGSMAIQINPKENPDGAQDLKRMAAALEKHDMIQVDAWKRRFVLDIAKNPTPAKDRDAIIRRVEAWGSTEAVRDMKGAYAAVAGGDREAAARLQDTAFQEIGAHVMGHDGPLSTPGAKDPKKPDVPVRK